MTRAALLATLATLSLGCTDMTLQPGEDPIEGRIDGVRRTPAEWEPQAAVWLQWPQAYEGRAVERSFVEIVGAIADYENVHLLAADAETEDAGRAALGDLPNVTWHRIANDNSWMRDNGARYVEIDGELVSQNWEFDGWGGGFGDIPYDADNAVPDATAEYLGLRSEYVRIVHERGDLEVNGSDTALVSWSVLSQRNPGMTREAMTDALSEVLGVTSVIYTEGFDPADGTRGHVDGMARFVSEDTIVVGDDGTALMENIAQQIRAQRPDLNVERMPLNEASRYLNWLVGDGFVLTASTGAEDAQARRMIEGWFPGREVRFVNIDALWNNGGGVHCVTNDQPE